MVVVIEENGAKIDSPTLTILLARVQFRRNGKNFHCLFTRFACRRTISYTRDDVLVCSKERERAKENERSSGRLKNKTERESVVS